MQVISFIVASVVSISIGVLLLNIILKLSSAHSGDGK